MVRMGTSATRAPARSAPACAEHCKAHDCRTADYQSSSFWHLSAVPHALTCDACALALLAAIVPEDPTEELLRAFALEVRIAGEAKSSNILRAVLRVLRGETTGAG